MKTLDRYIIRSFLTSVALCFVSMMLLRTIGDLFLNIDEFAELEFDSLGTRVAHVLRYYGYQSLLYVTELGGVIIVASAAFTLAVMNHTNELTAMLAAGVSLHRVSLPVVICAMVLGGLIVLDQELVIPRIANELVLSHDEKRDTVEFEVQLMTDSADSVLYAKHYNAGEQRMEAPAVLVRDEDYGLLALIAGREATSRKLRGQKGWSISNAHLVGTSRLSSIWPHKQDYQRIWTTISPIKMLEACASQESVPPERIESAEVQMYDSTYDMTLETRKFVPGPPPDGDADGWQGQIVKPVFTFAGPGGRSIGSFRADQAVWGMDENGDGYWELSGGTFFFPSDLTDDNLVLRESSNWMDYMSTSDLSRLINLRRVTDRGSAEMIKHTRFTAPLVNLVMLLLGLPFILSRERNIRASATLCVLTVLTFFAFVFICRYVGLAPVWGAWLPVLLFGPVAIIMFDAVKT